MMKSLWLLQSKSALNKKKEHSDGESERKSGNIHTKWASVGIHNKKKEWLFLFSFDKKIALKYISTFWKKKKKKMEMNWGVGRYILSHFSIQFLRVHPNKKGAHIQFKPKNKKIK